MARWLGVQKVCRLNWTFQRRASRKSQGARSAVDPSDTIPHIVDGVTKGVSGCTLKRKENTELNFKTDVLGSIANAEAACVR